MGMFGLPTGEFDLLLKDGKGEHWKNVMFTDSLYEEDIADCVEIWSVNYKVLSARFNGRTVSIPTGYHWELRSKDEVFGIYKTRKEAKAAMDERKLLRYKDKSIKVGLPVYVKE